MPSPENDAVSDFRGYQTSVIRISALLYAVAATIAAAVSLVPPLKDTINVLPAWVLIALAVLSALAVYAFPWDRLHPNWFLVVGVVASGHIALFLWATGGSESPFWPFVVFIVLAATAYYRDRWPLAVLSVLAIVIITSPLIYEHPSPRMFPAEVAIRSAIIGFSFVVGRLLFRGMRESTLIAARLQEEKDRVAKRRQFVSVVVHELRTPLTIVSGYGQLIQSRDDLPDRVREFALAQKEGWERMEALLADLQQFNQLEAGLSLDKKETDFNALLLAAVARARTWRGRCQIDVEAPPGLPPVECDARRVTQVLDNLLTNAVRYSPKGGSVTVTCRGRGAEVEVGVSDEGVGIPLEKQGQLFTPFYRAPRPAIADIPGTGLGLALCKNLVEAHQGRIWVVSEPGKGSRFHFTLPIRAHSSGGPDSGSIARSSEAP